MQIHPIRNDADHTAALRKIETLIDAQPGSLEGDELDILATLVVAYEKEHYAISAPDALTAIRLRMEQQLLTRRELEPFIGSRARVSEVLNGKRALSLNMIRKLSVGLAIPADILIQTGRGESGARPRTPPEKKKLSLERDRRNVYGGNAKSSRKNIPLGKALANRAVRHAADAPLRSVAGSFDEDLADFAANQSKAGQTLRPQKRFSKRPDAQLGDVLLRKAQQTGGSRSAFGTPPGFLKRRSAN